VKNFTGSILALLLLAGCGDSAELQRLTSENKELKDKMAGVTTKLEELEKKSQDAAAAAETHATEQQKLLESKWADERKALADEVEKLKTDLKKSQTDFESYKETYRLKVLRAPQGMPLPSFTSNDGTAYSSVVVLSRSHSSLTFRHARGASTIEWGKCPESIRRLMLAGEVDAPPAPAVPVVAAAPVPATAPSAYENYLMRRADQEDDSRRRAEQKQSEIAKWRAALAQSDDQLRQSRAALTAMLEAYSNKKRSGAGGNNYRYGSDFTAGGKTYQSYAIAHPPENTPWIGGRDLALRDAQALRSQILALVQKSSELRQQYIAAGGSSYLY
jgi:outer membrane murein-binding lipoprotein Lpp